jgi:hypothetical protein
MTTNFQIAYWGAGDHLVVCCWEDEICAVGTIGFGNGYDDTRPGVHPILMMLGA